jgi:hypothetical protein
MKARLSIAACTLVVVLCNSSFQNVVLGAGPAVATSSSAIADLTLQRGGVLNGRVISVDGKALENVEVAVFREGQHVGSGQTSGGGKFQLSGLRPGVYEVGTADGRERYRAWALGTAPPRAKLVAHIVDGGGQAGVNPQPRRSRWLAPTRYRLAGIAIVGAAIGGTVAVIAHDSNSPGS